MAQIPNIANLTINPVEVQDISQVIAQKLWQNENFLKLFNVVDGISKKTQILLDATSGRAGWKATGCAAVASGGTGYRDWETDRKSTRLNSSH